MRKHQKAKIKGAARVKKFNAAQDEAIDEPVEVVEREFELTQEQMDDVLKGKKRVDIINGKSELR